MKNKVIPNLDTFVSKVTEGYNAIDTTMIKEKDKIMREKFDVLISYS